MGKWNARGHTFYVLCASLPGSAGLWGAQRYLCTGTRGSETTTTATRSLSRNPAMAPGATHCLFPFPQRPPVRLLYNDRERCLRTSRVPHVFFCSSDLIWRAEAMGKCIDGNELQHPEMTDPGGDSLVRSALQTCVRAGGNAVHHPARSVPGAWPGWESTGIFRAPHHHLGGPTPLRPSRLACVCKEHRVLTFFVTTQVSTIAG